MKTSGVRGTGWRIALAVASVLALVCGASLGMASAASAATIIATSGTPTSITGGAITGTPRVGFELSFTDTSTTPADATLTYAWYLFGDPTHILSTAPDFTPGNPDVGFLVNLDVTATAPDFASSVTTYSTDNVQPATMSPSAYIEPNPVVGIQTSIDDSFWSPQPTSATYQWMVNGKAIPGATHKTYTPAASDAGKYLTATETGSRDGFGSMSFTTLESGPVAKQFTTIPTPTITGTAMVGDVLTAHAGSWVPAATTYTYTWFVNGAEEGGGPTFTPFDDSDSGLTVTVQVQGSAWDYGPQLSAKSLPTAPIAKGDVTAGKVALQTNPLSNDWVCANLTGWAQTTYWMVYYWYLDGTLVSTDPYSGCYRLPPDSRGETLTLTAGQDFPDSAPVLATSATYMVGKGNYGPSTLGIQINGSLTVGGTVFIDESYWSPEPTDFAVQWFALGEYGPSRIATGPTFTIPAKDVGKTIYAEVTGSGPLLTSGIQYTDTLAIGPGTIANVTAPRVTGPAAVGSKLSATPGSWSTASGVSYRYQWFSASSAGATPEAIGGATSSTYTPTKAQGGLVISVRVSAFATGYTSSPVFSGDTEAVYVPPALRPKPTTSTPHGQGPLGRLDP